MAIEFVINGAPVSVEDVDPHVTLLEWLRSSGRTGTKEGCAEGECGACAVALVRADAAGKTAYEVINSCLLPLPAVHGLELVSVEGVAPAPDTLHPVQEAMVRTGGSQCGYCTPGFVVSLFAEYHRPGRDSFDLEAIAGNLCRCTGYRLIRDAALSLPRPAESEPGQRRLQLAPTAPQPIHHECGARSLFRPTTLDELFAIWEQNPKATLLAGGTDLIVYVNQRQTRYDCFLAIEELEPLRGIEETDTEISIGAAEPLAHVERRLQHVPMLAQLLPLFSSRLIRNRATLGGNLGTASPIGDSPPALLALGAEVTLLSKGAERRIALAELFTGYRQTQLAERELIAKVHLPKPLAPLQRFYKVSKRVHDDISTVAAGFALQLDGAGQVSRLGMGLGGVAATPLKPATIEAAAAGKPWSWELVCQLSEQLQAVGTPMDDHRGSANYRGAMLGQLLKKFFVDTTTEAEAAQ